MSGHIGLGFALLDGISDLDPPRERRALRRQRLPYGSKGPVESPRVPAPLEPKLRTAQREEVRL